MLLLLWLVALARIDDVISYDLGADDPISDQDQMWLNSLFYIPDEPRVRKEYRTLTETERTDLHDAFRMLKEDTTVTPNKYDLLSSLHTRRSSRNSAHSGTGFLGWHRVYVLLMENALREKKSNVTLAYWDCTMDALLEKPRAAAIWSEDFMGNGDGYVTSGVFRYWSTTKGHLYRRIGKSGGPINQHDIDRFLIHDYIADISNPLAKYKQNENIVEDTHNRVHNWIGGEMKVIETAAEDPVFFIYHSFVSYVWELFRAHQRRRGIDPATDWDENYGHMRHNMYAPMGLGNLMASDGNSDVFAENIVFADRPQCSLNNTDCLSPHLYCNVTVERCAPWTVNEYDGIKRATWHFKSTFIDEARNEAHLKIMKGFQELDMNSQSAHDSSDGFISDKSLIGNEFKGGTKKDDLSNTDITGQNSIPEGTLTGRGNAENRNNKSDIDRASNEHKQPEGLIEDEFIAAYVALLVLAILLIIRISLSITTKCTSKRNNRETTSQKRYNMDGIMSAKHGNDKNNIKREVSVPKSERKVGNIYTVTVTSTNPDTGGTFVRFVKFENGEKTMVSSAEHLDKIGTDMVSSIEQLDKTGADNINSLSNTDSNNDSNTDSNNDSNNDYVDMTYATRIANGSITSDDISDEIKVIDELFENVHRSEDDRQTGGLASLERRLNSPESEHGFMTHTLSNTNATFTHEDEYDDIFDDYDNIEFTREALEQKYSNLSSATTDNMAIGRDTQM